MPGLGLHGACWARTSWASLIARRRAARVRARAVRPPAVGALLPRHDRPAEGDRPVPGRDPARAPEDAAPARRRAGRRPAVLVHHDGLDDVELHRLGAADRGDGPALRRLARVPGHGRAVGLRGAHADDDVRDERELHRGVHEGGRRAGRGARSVARCKAVGSTGSPLSPEGFRWVYEHVGSDTWLFSTSGGTDLCTAFVGGVPLEPVYEGELQARALGAAIESWDPEGKSLNRRGRRARADRADALDADLLLGRRGRLALPRGVLRHLPRRLAPRRLDRDHRPRHRDHQRPLRRDDQPRRHPHGHGRDLPRGAGRRRRSSTRWSSTSRSRAPTPGCRCSSSCARARR